VHLTVRPILAELRALYDVGERNTLERFWAYKRLMVDGPELLPLGDFSPMGERQPPYLDDLLKLGAEGLATELARQIESELNDVRAEFQLMLVVADQARNGWTQRWLTDAAWRFGAQQPLPPPADHRWITVQLWTHVPPTTEYLASQVRGAVMRAVWRARHGDPVTLDDMLAQEGAALRFGHELFAGQPLRLEPDELSYTRQVVDPLRGSDHWPTCFAALYGDEAAREVGYPPLGLSVLAGLGLALSESADGTGQVERRF